MAASLGALTLAPTAPRSDSEEGGFTLDRLRTALCALLPVEYPAIQSGMGGGAGPELVAEICRVGGFGILAGIRLNGEKLRQGIRRVRELTYRPFGVNLWVHTALRSPVDPAGIPEETVRCVQDTLNGFRKTIGIPAKSGPPGPVPDVIDEPFEVILKERVPCGASACVRMMGPRVRTAPRGLSRSEDSPSFIFMVTRRSGPLSPCGIGPGSDGAGRYFAFVVAMMLAKCS